MAVIKVTVKIHGGDYDCSELVRMCCAAVGLISWNYFASYMWTGNEVELLKQNGFVERSLYDPQVGDILWRAGHTEVYLGEGMQGGARHGDAPGGLTGRQGDQSGTEIMRSAYRASDWTKLLRYEGPKTCGGIPAGVAIALVADHIIDDDAHGYSQPNRAGDGTVEEITLSWDDGKAEPKNGWLYEDGHWYLYANDKPKKGAWVRWAKDDPYSGRGFVWYYFDANGRLVVSDWLKSGGAWWYFDKAGIMVRNTAEKYGDGLCPFGDDGKAVKSGEVSIKVTAKGWKIQPAA